MEHLLLLEAADPDLICYLFLMSWSQRRPSGCGPMWLVGQWLPNVECKQRQRDVLCSQCDGCGLGESQGDSLIRLSPSIRHWIRFCWAFSEMRPQNETGSFPASPINLGIDQSSALQSVRTNNCRKHWSGAEDCGLNGQSHDSVKGGADLRAAHISWCVSWFPSIILIQFSFIYTS